MQEIARRPFFATVLADQVAAMGLHTKAPPQTESELIELPNISRADARKIIRGRPYHDSQELITKHIVSDDKYAKIKDIVTVQ